MSWSRRRTANVFGRGGKTDRKTNLEFGRDLTTHFGRWCTALRVETFEELCELMMLEQSKHSVPEDIATHITGQKVNTVSEAAASAVD